MPLYKKQVVGKIPLRQALHPDSEVFVIPFTGEVFVSYETYISRLLFYKRRIWSCEATSKEGLTYQEALESETMALNMIMSAFPEAKRHWALSLLHYNSCTVADIIDMMLQKFSNPLEEEIVSSAGSSYRVIGPQDDVSIKVIKVDDYTIGNGIETAVVVLPLNKIKRDKQLTSKIALKRFIKDVAVKEGGNIGGTWMVKPELVARYRLNNKPSQEVEDWQDQKKILEMQDPSKKYGKGFPVEDSELFGFVEETKGPVPCYDFGEIDENLVPEFMTVWNFLSIFSTKLNITPFTFEEFKTCICFQSDDYLPDIIAESFAALLALACIEWTNNVSSLTVIAAQNTGSLDNINSSSNDASMEIIDKKSADQVAFELLYETFTVEEKAALDQWYKWAPEKWMSKDRRKATQKSVKEKYKAWQIALAGLIRDWMTDDIFPEKYSFLISVFQDVADPVKESEIKSETPDTNDKDFDAENNNEGDVSENNSNASEEDDESDSDHSNGVQYSLRKKRKIIKDEDDGEAKDGQSEPSRKSRVKSSPPKGTESTAEIGVSLTAQHTLEITRLCRNAEHGFSKSTNLDRIRILFFLVHSCVEPSVDIHSYIDQCIEKIAELKRNQRALIKDRKVIKEQREGFNKRDKQKLKELGVTNGAGETPEGPILDGENHEGSVIDGSEKLDEDMLDDAEKPDDSVIDASDRLDEDEDHESDMPKNQKTLRHRKVSMDEQKREEGKRSDVWEKIKKESKEVQKEFKAHEDERRKIEDKERNFSEKEYSIDLQLRAASGPLRVRCLGQDRYFNRYWWFDGSIGTQSSSDSSFFAPKGKHKNVEWASGCLFVEDFGFDSSLGSKDAALDVVKTGNLTGKWGYYSKANQAADLINWLDVRGVRERNLINNLSKIEDLLLDGMEQRNKDSS